MINYLNLRLLVSIGGVLVQKSRSSLKKMSYPCVPTQQQQLVRKKFYYSFWELVRRTITKKITYFISLQFD